MSTAKPSSPTATPPANPEKPFDWGKTLEKARKKALGGGLFVFLELSKKNLSFFPTKVVSQL
jgi:hypothetical protein